MNKNIFRNRTIIGAVCILLAVLVCFGITPLFNVYKTRKTKNPTDKFIVKRRNVK